MSISKYAPIARELLPCDTETRARRKFVLAYFPAKENLALTKMAPLCQLEVRYGVDFGSSYKNIQACTTFLTYVT